VDRGSVAQLGDVITGAAEGRSSDDETTLFDSTGLAIQDLAIVQAVYEGWREGRFDAPVVKL
jgi:ornithine cyclodeaminase/alanine dehydrogenase-like protein (mu-crystallin family)